MVKFFKFLGEFFHSKNSDLNESRKSNKSTKSKTSTKSTDYDYFNNSSMSLNDNFDSKIFNNQSTNLNTNLVLDNSSMSLDEKNQYDIDSFNKKMFNNQSTNLNTIATLNNLSTNLDNLVLNNSIKSEEQDKSLFIVKKINNVLKLRNNKLNYQNTLDEDTNFNEFNLNNQSNKSYKIDNDDLVHKFNKMNLSKNDDQLNRIINILNSVRIKNYSPSNLKINNDNFKSDSLNERQNFKEWNPLNNLDEPIFDPLSIKSQSIESINEQSNLNQLIKNNNVDYNIAYINDDIVEDDELADDLLDKNIFTPLLPDSCEAGVCYYCKLDKHVVKCLDCDICFCNGKGKLNTSHIVHHLIRAKHNRVDFRLDRVKNNANSCNVCGQCNVFQLGFLSSNQNNRYLICRAPCKKVTEEYINQKKQIIERPIYENQDEYFRKLRKALPHLLINGEEELRAIRKDTQRINLIINTRQEIVNISKWKPLIDSNKQFVDYVISVPFDKKDKDQCRSVNIDKIDEVEDELDEFRKINQNKFGIKTDDLIKDDQISKIKLTPVLLMYKNGTEYKDTFLKLVQLERKVERLRDDDSLGSLVVYERIKNALDLFEVNKSGINSIIYDTILGKFLKNNDYSSFSGSYIDLEAPNLPDINESQRNAIVHALNNPLTLIQGPPGTGKTLTAAVLIYNLFKKFSTRLRLKKILVCAPSNCACDHLADKISKTNLKVIRVLSKMKEEDPTYYSPLSIHHKIKKPPIGSELYDFMEILSRRVASRNDEEKLTKLQLRYARELVNEADIVCVTCCTSMDKRLRYANFDYLLIDEVCQATEPESIIPLTCSKKGVQKLIMIGDQKQLAPVIKNSQCVAAGFDQSMFQRLLALGVESFMLDHQYRMHPFISLYPRHQYYNGLLKDGINENDRKLQSYKFPITNRPIFFYCCKDEEQTSVNGCSFLNQKECNYIGKILVELARSGIEPSQIGIITPYEGQRSHLRNNLKFFGGNIRYDQIEIESINAYQGREKDIIILSTVRSNYKKGKRSIGFLSDQKRLNVALTRAKYGLIIVGDPTTLCKHPTWFNLIKFYQENNLLYSGDATNLTIEKRYKFKQPDFDKDDVAKLKSNYHIRIERYDEIKDTNIEEFQKVEFFT